MTHGKLGLHGLDVKAPAAAESAAR
jgi:hypothetical protein